MAWEDGTAENVPGWCADLGICERFGWSLEYVEELPRIWRARAKTYANLRPRKQGT